MCYNLGLFTFLTLICVYVCVVRTGHGSCVEVTRQFAVPSFHLWFWVRDGMTSSGEVTVPSSPVALSRQSQFFNSGNRICLIHYNNVIWIAHTTHTHTPQAVPCLSTAQASRNALFYIFIHMCRSVEAIGRCSVSPSITIYLTFLG